MFKEEPYSFQSNQKTVIENTLSYLENYLDPNRNWDRKISPKERINRIRNSNVNWKTVSNHIRNMEYQSFLKTPYWKAIADHTKFRAGYRCQVCNSSYELITHHRNYAIHGAEHANMWELTVLCNSCHNKFHDYPVKYKHHDYYVKSNSNSREKVFLFILGIVMLITLFYSTLEN